VNHYLSHAQIAIPELSSFSPSAWQIACAFDFRIGLPASARNAVAGDTSDSFANWRCVQNRSRRAISTFDISFFFFMLRDSLKWLREILSLAHQSQAESLLLEILSFHPRNEKVNSPATFFGKIFIPLVASNSFANTIYCFRTMFIRDSNGVNAVRRSNL
jgi:hypothetical protein